MDGDNEKYCLCIFLEHVYDLPLFLQQQVSKRENISLFMRPLCYLYIVITAMMMMSIPLHLECVSFFLLCVAGSEKNNGIDSTKSCLIFLAPWVPHSWLDTSCNDMYKWVRNLGDNKSTRLPSPRVCIAKKSPPSTCLIREKIGQWTLDDDEDLRCNSERICVCLEELGTRAGGTHTHTHSQLCGYCVGSRTQQLLLALWFILWLCNGAQHSFRIQKTQREREFSGKSWYIGEESIRRFIIYSNGRPLDD